MNERKDWICNECGKRMTLKQAERAADKGCSKCGGVDVDLAPTGLWDGSKECRICSGAHDSRDHDLLTSADRKADRSVVMGVPQ